MTTVLNPATRTGNLGIPGLGQTLLAYRRTR